MVVENRENSSALLDTLSLYCRSSSLNFSSLDRPRREHQSEAGNNQYREEGNNKERESSPLGISHDLL
ncbi:9553_t:CDS:2 [Paraglomus occultum]|uniref:9553_t:CDS:1 n=1 Tax=Paraglomus occultum TaxID=144539 RepID=A0A9N9H2F8_9GLOM|nr:9553_t:CDS:2 [Paraglomus occultum]